MQRAEARNLPSTRLARNWRTRVFIPHLVPSHFSWSSKVREFCDPAGAAWRVFRATPHSSSSKREKVLPEAFRHGWLVFECDVERRRLAPIPDDWEELTDAELAQLCLSASVVPSRTRRRRAGGGADGPAASAEADAVPKRAAEVHRVLAHVLEEVCDQAPVTSLDTGQLIRVEQTLAIAASAAREAVALRRAMHEKGA